MAYDNLRVSSLDQVASGENAPNFDLDAEHDSARARRVSNAGLRREQAKLQQPDLRLTTDETAENAPTHAHAMPRGTDLDGLATDANERNDDAFDSRQDSDELRAAKTPVSSGARQQTANRVAAGASAGALSTKDKSLDFNAVVGRPTLSRSVTIVNNSDRYASGTPYIEAQGANAGAFSIDAGRHGFIAPPERDNKDREIVSVRYHAPSAGSHHATLVLPTEVGELRIELHGKALDIGTHAKTLGDEHGPEPIHEISDKKPKTRDEGLALAMEAADAVSSLARTVETTLIGGDVARMQFGQQLLAAGASLNTRILAWVHEEGLDRVEAMQQDAQGSAADFIRYVAGKGIGATLKVLSKENIITAYAFEAIDLGLSVYFGRGANQDTDSRARDYGQHMGDVMGMAIPATDAATKGLAMRFASLMSQYAVARADMMRLAGPRAQKEIGDLHAAIEANNLDRLTSQIADARMLLSEFESARDEWAQALKQIAAAGIKAQQVADTGFAALLEKYIEFRASGNKEIADHERKVVCSGWIDFGEPWNIQHTGFTFGKFNDPSSTVAGHIDHKRLTELGAKRGSVPRPGWEVKIRLSDLKHEGAVVLTQGAAGPQEREAKFEGNMEGRLRAVGGVEKLWSMLDSVTLGTNVIWGGKR